MENRKGLPAEVRRTKAGFGLLAVVFIILVFSVLAIGFVSFISSESRLTVDEYRYSRAFYIAEAGRNFTVKKVSGIGDWTQPLGLPVTKSFEGGSFTVSATDAAVSSVTLNSVGLFTADGKTCQRTVRTNLVKTPWGFTADYVLYWGSGGSGGGTAVGNNVSIYGNILVNGSITLGNDASVEGDAQAAGNISGGTVTGTREPNSPMPGDPPRIITTYYDNQISLAASSETPSQSWDNYTISADMYINGSLTIGNSKTITVIGSPMVVVNGSVTTGNNVIIGNNLTLIAKDQITAGNGTSIGNNCPFYSRAGFTFGNNLDSSSFEAGQGTSFITPGSVTCGNNAGIYGFIYCGSSLVMGNNTTFYGNIVANQVSAVGNGSQLYLNPGLVDYNSIQGLAGGSGTILSTWEEVY